MDYSILLLTIIKMTVLLGFGMLFVYKMSMTPDIKRFLIFLIINIGLPALILSGFLQLSIDEQLLKQIALIFIFSICFHLIGVFLGWSVAKGIRFESQKARETGYLSNFGNTGLIGIPLCASIFGPEGAVFAAVFDAGMGLMMWTVGILFIQEKRKISWDNLKSMISMPVVAILVGFIVTLTDLNVGFFIKDMTTTLSGIASPLAMFYIGMLIMSILKGKKKLRPKLIVVPVSLKLIMLPLLGIIALSLLPFHDNIEQTLLIQMTMPTITTASIIMAMYHADEEYGVITTMFTTLLSLITIPLLTFIGGIWIS